MPSSNHCPKDSKASSCGTDPLAQKTTDTELWLTMMNSMLNFTIASTNLMKCMKNAASAEHNVKGRKICGKDIKCKVRDISPKTKQTDEDASVPTQCAAASDKMNSLNKCKCKPKGLSRILEPAEIDIAQKPCAPCAPEKHCNVPLETTNNKSPSSDDCLCANNNDCAKEEIIGKGDDDVERLEEKIGKCRGKPSCSCYQSLPETEDKNEEGKGEEENIDADGTCDCEPECSCIPNCPKMNEKMNEELEEKPEEKPEEEPNVQNKENNDSCNCKQGCDCELCPFKKERGENEKDTEEKTETEKKKCECEPKCICSPHCALKMEVDNAIDVGDKELAGDENENGEHEKKEPDRNNSEEEREEIVDDSSGKSDKQIGDGVGSKKVVTAECDCTPNCMCSPQCPLKGVKDPICVYESEKKSFVVEEGCECPLKESSSSILCYCDEEIEEDTSKADCFCQTASSEDVMIQQLRLEDLEYQLRFTQDHIRKLKKEVDRLRKVKTTNKAMNAEEGIVALYNEIMKSTISIDEILVSNSMNSKSPSRRE